jgi:hypothetical protein
MTYLYSSECARGSRRLNENDAVSVSKKEQKDNKLGVKKLTDV